MMPMRHLTCCICSAHAGYWAQHYNRDIGWGICASCAAEQAGKETPENMASYYGKPGVNYEAPTHVILGRRFRVVAKFYDTEAGQKKANAFMEANPDVGVLDVIDGRVILARMDDKGVEA